MELPANKREHHPRDGFPHGGVFADQDVVDALAERWRVVVDVQEFDGHDGAGSQGRRAAVEGLDAEVEILAELVVEIICHGDDAWNDTRCKAN